MVENAELRVLVSVVNYCSANWVCDMLPSLIQQIDKSHDKVVIVDNSSPDDSLRTLLFFIKSYGLEEYVDIVASDKNGGFSYGNNLALKATYEKYGKDPSFVWLLNPDTQVLDGALDNLLSFLNTTPKAGIVGSRLEDENGTPQESAFNYYSIASELLSGLSLGILDKVFFKQLVSYGAVPTEPFQCGWVAGASMMVRMEAINQVGMMDEKFFLYFEETDFCLQIIRAGWQCWYVPSSRVIHHIGQSTGVVSGDTKMKRRPKYWFQSRQYYFKKNHGLVYTMIADISWGGGFLLLKLRNACLGRKGVDPKYLLRDFWRNSIFLSWISSR